MKHCLTITLAVIAALLSTSQKAQAYGWNTCGNAPLKWLNNSYTLRASSISFASNSVWRSALQDVISRLNANPSNFFFNLSLDEPSVALNNNESETWFSSDPAVLGGSPAINYWNWSCGQLLPDRIYEADVIFDVNTNYTTNTDKNALFVYGGSSRPFQTTATHEYGHSLGLLHENRVYNVMGHDFNHIHTNAGRSKSYLGEDATSGAIFLYGLYSNASQDLSVAHWKYLGTDGEYSTHQRTQIYDSAGNAITPSVLEGEPVYSVARGQPVGVELTYENNGGNNLLARIGFYLSTNDNVSNLDTILAIADLNLNRDSPDTIQYNGITIPSNLTPGRYWIGVVVDMDSGYTEIDESNNATYIALDVF